MASCHKAVGSAMWFEINISPVDFRREQTEMAWTCNVQRKDSEHIGRPGTLLFYGHSHFGFKIFDKNSKTTMEIPKGTKTISNINFKAKS